MEYTTRQTVLGLMVAVAMMTAATLSVTPIVHAQVYPSRDITFIVPFGPGGAADLISRPFCRHLEKVLPGNINIENKPGGAATIGATVVVQAKPDGYTIGLGENGALAYQPLVNKDLVYKTPDDYQPIIKMVEIPYTLAVSADAKWKTFEEFMADVRKNPGKIRASVSGLRSTSDLVLQQLNRAAGVKITSVPFTGGGGEAIVALLGGRVESLIITPAAALGQVQAGKIRVLAIFTKGKFDLYPDAASVFDAGYDATLSLAYFVIAPKGIPMDVQNKLVAASLEVGRNEEFLKFVKARGFKLDMKGPEAAKADIIQNTKTFADLIEFVEKK